MNNILRRQYKNIQTGIDFCFRYVILGTLRTLEKSLQNCDLKMEAALKTEVAILVVLEMCMSLLGIVCNLLIVATVRQDETLRATTLNFLLFNLCFSNLLIAFFVKPISAIYTGYAMSTDQWQVRNIIHVVLTYIKYDFMYFFPNLG